MTGKASSAKNPLSKDTVQSRLAAAWARTIAQNGGKKNTFADAIGVHPDTVSNALAGNTVPELHTVLNSLFACPNALDEVMALYGYILVPEGRALSLDMLTLVEASRFVTHMAEALEDRKRNHQETLQLADLARPLAQKLLAIVSEADAIKSGANLRSVA